MSNLQAISLNFIEVASSNIIIGLVSGGLSAWITYKLAFRRFRAEKWWERRADAYIAILDSLYRSLKFSETHIDYAQSNRELPQERDADLRKDSFAANAEIDRSINTGKLFLSASALDRLTRFVAEGRQNSSESWTDYILEEYELTRTCLEDFVNIARKDLGTNI